MIVFVLCVFGYFLGFLSNLFKALGSKPFIVPPTDIARTYLGLTDWEHLRYALAAVVQLSIFAGKTATLYVDNQKGEPTKTIVKVDKKGIAKVTIQPNGGLIIK